MYTGLYPAVGRGRRHRLGQPLCKASLVRTECIVESHDDMTRLAGTLFVCVFLPKVRPVSVLMPSAASTLAAGAAGGKARRRRKGGSGGQSTFICPSPSPAHSQFIYAPRGSPRHVSARLAICPCRGGQGSSAPSKAAKAAVDWYENGGAVTLTHTHDESHAMLSRDRALLIHARAPSPSLARTPL